MLELLRVRAFAIIDELEAHFAPGFNVLTGETGAGESLPVDALHPVPGGAGHDSDEIGRAERASFLRYQLGGLEKADPRAGEDEALAQERRVLAAAEKLRGGAEEAEALLRSGDEAAVVAASRACKRLDELAGIDPSLAAVAAAVRGATAELDEAARTLSRYAGRAGGGPQRLEAIDERLELLRRPSRKPGGGAGGGRPPGGGA